MRTGVCSCRATSGASYCTLMCNSFDIIATPDRGTFMGNRGVLHDADGRIRRAWQLKRWIVCVLEFKGQKRQVLMPGHYPELFFLDEAIALAAGHRPCAE